MSHAARPNSTEEHVPHTNIPHILRRYFEFAQDLIVATLCVILLVVMTYALWALARMAFIEASQPSQILSQIVLVLILIELFRSLIFYLREHRVSVSLMLEIAVVSELRQILLYPPTSFGAQALGNALLLSVVGSLLLADRYLSWKRRLGTPSETDVFHDAHETVPELMTR